jgi:hypothetical protein
MSTGRTLQAALQYGQASLQMIASTQVSDAGRTADQTAMVANGSHGYVRMVVGKTCSRCVVLAGRWYRWDAGFDRHPHCDCVGVPAAEDRSGDLTTDPDAYFRSLTRSEQDATFGRAGAQAIRDGADMGQVVNARSGMYSASGQQLTRSGKRGQGTRLMPEEIYKESFGDRQRAMELLREHRYITPGRAPAITHTDQAAYTRRLAGAAKDQSARAATPLSRLRSRDRMSQGELRALYDYTGMTYGEVNRPLRRGLGSLRAVTDPGVRAQIRLMDAAMSRSALTSDVVLYRGTSGGSRIFGSHWDSNLTGAEWTEHAYLSTSSSQRQAAIFANSHNGAQIRLLVPKGTHGIELTGDDAEAEVLLQRGLRLVVVSDTGPGSTPRVINVQVMREANR